jgi:hypothetical protein
MDSLTAAELLLRATDAWYPYEIDPSAVSEAELALAGLARCRRLLWGMIRLHGDGSDLAGTHARTLYETWIGSLYALFGGEEARERLEANDLHEQRRQATAMLDWLDENAHAEAGLYRQCQEVLGASPPSHGRLSLKAMATALRRHATNAGQDDSTFYEQAYALLYGPESYMTTHGGIGVIKRHIDFSDGAVVADGRMYRGEDRRLELAIAMVMGLAKQVAAALDLDRQALDVSAEQWQAGLTHPSDNT